VNESGQAPEQDVSDADLDALIAQHARLSAADPDALIEAIALHLERARRNDADHPRYRADLTQAIALATGVIDAEPPGAPTAHEASIHRAIAAAGLLFADPPPPALAATVDTALTGLPDAIDHFGPEAFESLDVVQATTALYADRFERTEDPADLDQFLHWQRTLATDFEPVPPHDHLDLARALLRRDTSDAATEALAAAEKALATLAPADDDYPDALAITGRARTTVHLTDLDTSWVRGLSELRTAVELTPADDPARRQREFRLSSAILAGAFQHTADTGSPESTAAVLQTVRMLGTSLDVRSLRDDEPLTITVVGMTGMANAALSESIAEPDLLPAGLHLMEWALPRVAADDPFRATLSGFLATALSTAVQLKLRPSESLTLAVDGAIAENQRAFDRLPDGDPARVTIAHTLGMLLYGRYQAVGALTDLDLAIEYGWTSVKACDRADPVFVAAVYMLAVPFVARLTTAPRARDLEQADKMRQLVAAARQLAGPSHAMRGRLDEMVAIFAYAPALLPAADGSTSLDKSTDPYDLLIDNFGAVRDSQSDAAMQSLTNQKYGFGLAGRSTVGTPNAPLLVRGLDILRTEVTNPDNPNPAYTKAVLGSSLWAAYRVFHDERFLHEAISWLEQCPVGTDGAVEDDPHDAQWSLAGAYRASGNLPGSRAAGLRSLMRHARRVLIQDGAEDWLAVARRAAGRAVAVAGWCIVDRALTEAIGALELGQGMVLHAATTASRQVPLLPIDPPSIVDIQEALRRSGNDALCYLVPAAAIVVRRYGEPLAIPLPDLDFGAQPIRDYWAALRSDGDPHAPSPRPAVEAWCDWAWPAAIGPLLDVLGSDQPHVAMVSAGDYGELPWHAARRPVGGGYRYALEDAVLTTVPTARLLCRLAGRGYLPLDGRALVIGDPDGTDALPASAIEAKAVHAQLYPHGTLLGQLAGAGAATPAAVLAALPGGVQPQPVVHLAGHAAVAERPIDAALFLAGGASLTVQTVLDQARRASPDHAGPLVDLGACTTGVTSANRDEALSLAATFLVAGAIGAVGTLWEVPDRRSAALQYLFHHLLVREGMSPAHALRAAQLAFLQPGELPPGMPAELRLPADRAGVSHPAIWAGFMLQGVGMSSGDHPVAVMMARGEALVGDPTRRPPSEQPLAAAALRALSLLRDAYEGAAGFELRTALAEVLRIAETVGETEPYAFAVEQARIGLRQLVAVTEGDVSGYGATARDIPHPNGRFTTGAAAITAEVQAMGTAAVQDHFRGDSRALREKVRRMRELTDQIPADDQTRALLDSALAPGESLMRLGADERSSPIHSDEVAIMRVRAQAPGYGRSERAAWLSVAGSAALDRGDHDAAIADLADAVHIVPDHDPVRAGYLSMLGLAYLQRVRRSLRRDDLDNAIARLEEARAHAGSGIHALWAHTAQPLAFAYRLRGENGRGREVALTGLRGYAWTVLLQATVEDRHVAARSAAEDALETARMCLADGETGEAVRALDAGRGLILYAATETRDVYARLQDGHPELARRWRHGAGDPNQVPNELRRAAVSALTGIPLTADGSLAESPASGSARLLDPPAPEEIRAALGAVGADALAYLMPEAAVVVPAEGPVFWIPLPELRAEKVGELAGLAEPAEVDGDPLHGSRRALEAACDWAWSAAVGPLLVRLPRSAHVVLVPIGEFARVPWHAARRRRQYALERATFSYAASARLLCETAGRAAVPLSGTGLIVGDPETEDEAASLRVARTEAWAIRAAFYPAGRYLGRPPEGERADGAGTAAEVAAWLSTPDSGAVLHLACHGVLRAPTAEDPDSSYLMLAGDRLSAEDLTWALGPDHGIALAVLAACRSGEASRGYDEAFSLGTAFLTSGVRSVISAQWSVPDGATSVLMFMVHHYLNAGLAPAAALRAAQLWMINDRTPPESMPEPLRSRVRAYPPAANQWAAFTHIGR
jgi:CHAT domain-containing protein